MIRRRLTSKQREALWQCEAETAIAAGRGEHPICRLCDLPVLPGRLWDINHQGHKPQWLGGVVDGISHRKCNRENNRVFATPLFAKNERVRLKFLDLKRARTPMRGGRDDALKKTMRGDVVVRASGLPPYPRTPS